MGADLGSLGTIMSMFEKKKAGTIGGMMGIIQLLSGMNQRKKAEGMYPDIPPEYLEYQKMLRQQMRNAETGSLYSSLLGKARAMLGYGAETMLRNGMPGYAVANKGASDIINQLLGIVQKDAFGYNQLYGNTTKDIADMQVQLGLGKWANMNQRAQGNLKTGQENLLAALGYNRKTAGLENETDTKTPSPDAPTPKTGVAPGTTSTQGTPQLPYDFTPQTMFGDGKYGLSNYINPYSY